MARVAGECGLEVAVATRVRAHGERLAAEGIRVIATSMERGTLNPLRAAQDFLQLFSILRAERPDIVHCIALRCSVIGGLAARLAGAKNIVLAVTGLGYLWLESGLIAAFLRHLTRVVIGNWLNGPQTYYIFENHDDPVDLNLDAKDPRVTVVGGAGVDPANYPMVPEPPAPPLKVAVVARMIWPKGIVEAVQAVQRARSRVAEIELDIFGTPDPANPWSIPTEMLHEWSAMPGVVWHGHVADVPKVWREHHVALFLSWYREGLPRAVVEAAACGRPIVATDVTGCREVVRNGTEGILVRSGDVDGAANALIELAGDKAMRTRLGAAAHARFRERFTAAAVRQAVGNLYRALTESRR
jgi:glycosyltransferase involved in cell wall biosynthesis